MNLPTSPSPSLLASAQMLILQLSSTRALDCVLCYLRQALLAPPTLMKVWTELQHCLCEDLVIVSGEEVDLMAEVVQEPVKGRSLEHSFAKVGSAMLIVYAMLLCLVTGSDVIL